MLNPTRLIASLALCSAYTLSATVIATYPPGNTLENIAIAPAGDLFVTSSDYGIVYQISSGGSSRVFGQVPAPVTGIALNTDGTVVAPAAHPSINSLRTARPHSWQLSPARRV